MPARGPSPAPASCWGRGRSPLPSRPRPPRGLGGRGRSLSGGDGLPGQHKLLSGQFGVIEGRLELLGRRPDQYRGLCQPPLLALREGFSRAPRGDGGAEAGPAVVAVVPLGGAIGVRHRCYPGRHVWLHACPSHYLLVHQWRAAGSAVWCCEGGRGGGGAGGGDASGRSGVGGHPPALGREAVEAVGPLATPELPVWGGAQGPGPPGVLGWCQGGSHKVDPRNGGDSLCSKEGVHLVPRLGRQEGGAGHGRCPIEVGGGDPEDPLQVPAGRDHEEQQGVARALLPEDLPSVVDTPGPG